MMSQVFEVEQLHRATMDREMVPGSERRGPTGSRDSSRGDTYVRSVRSTPLFYVKTCSTRRSVLTPRAVRGFLRGARPSARRSARSWRRDDRCAAPKKRRGTRRGGEISSRESLSARGGARSRDRGFARVPSEGTPHKAHALTRVSVSRATFRKRRGREAYSTNWGASVAGQAGEFRARHTNLSYTRVNQALGREVSGDGCQQRELRSSRRRRLRFRRMTSPWWQSSVARTRWRPAPLRSSGLRPDSGDAAARTAASVVASTSARRAADPRRRRPPALEARAAGERGVESLTAGVAGSEYLVRRDTLRLIGLIRAQRSAKHR